MRTILFYCLISIALYSCQSKSVQQQTNKSKETDNVTQTCRTNPEHSYQVFVPTVDGTNKKLPLLIAIDSHGDGKLAVGKFKEAALKDGVIVAASNRIKNDDPDYIREIEELVADVKNRYQAGDILFIGGFSGGARMSIGYALSHKVNGVIAYGALASSAQISALNCKIVAVTGMDDFNFMEAVPFIINPQLTPSNLCLEITDAIHEWPSQNVTQQSLAFLLISDKTKKTAIDEKQIVQEYVAGQKQRIEKLTKNGDYIQAALIARNMHGNTDFKQEDSFTQYLNQIQKDKNYQQQINELSQNVETELKLRKSYYNALLTMDSAWWKQEIDTLNSKIKTEKDKLLVASFKRIKGFIGILCYSMCQHFTEEKDIQNLEKALTVYQIAEPDNTDMLDFRKKLGKMKGK